MPWLIYDVHYELGEGYINPCVRRFDWVVGVFVRMHILLKLCTYMILTLFKMFSQIRVSCIQFPVR